MDIQKHFNIDLLEELGMYDMPVKERAEMLDRMGEILMDSIMIRVFTHLDPEDQEAVATLSEQSVMGQNDDVFNFLNSKIPNLNNIVEEEIAQFKKESMDFLRAMG